MDLTDPGTVTAVIDWELSTLGDPLTDLGLLLFYWREPEEGQPALTSAVTTTPGFPGRAAVKVAAPEMATWVIDKAIQAHGGGGVGQDFPLAELYAQARMLRLADGPERGAQDDACPTCTAPLRAHNVIESDQNHSI